MRCGLAKKDILKDLNARMGYVKIHNQAIESRGKKLAMPYKNSHFRTG